MQEKNDNELTLRSSSFKEVDHDGGEYDLRVVESKFDGESPIVGVIVKDEPERSGEHGDEGAEHGDSDDDDDDFEFTFAGVDRDSDWFPPGEVFPIFDRRLLSETESLAIQNDQMQTVRSALKQLFIVGDRNRDEESELDGIASGSYCVWTPGNSPQASPARCKKSSSTGSTAKRWSASLKELLIRRSRSDGKASLVRFGNLVKTEKGESAVVKMKKAAVNGGGEKRRATYLPYKKEIIGFGFYPSVNGFGGVNRNRPPF
ncbi:unnamed protein product [Rhodiola kirilowii]